MERTVHAGGLARRDERARRIGDLLRDEILSGVHGSGILPSETVLAKRFTASRNSIREALDLLRREGILARVRGAGTFVLRTKAVHQVDRLAGMAETQEDGHRRVTVEVLVVELIRAPLAVATRLELEPGSEVVMFDRRLDLDGEPLSLWTSYLPSDVADGLRPGNAGIDFYELVENELGMEVGAAEFLTEARLADESLARVLEIEPGAPILFIERVMRDRAGRPLEFGFVRMRGDRIQFRSQLTRVADAGASA